MSAVWSASRAAVRRRRLQTVVIGLVVTATTATLLLGLSLLHAASGPFDRAFAEQRGAHAVASFDLDRVGAGELAAAGRASGAMTAGPFEVASLEFDEDWLWNPPGTLVVAGRAAPGGTVDQVRMVAGRWAEAPGEIVLNWDVDGSPGTELLGSRLAAPGAPPLTIVGFATSLSRSAGAWVTPGQVAELHPYEAQLLYRFAGDPDGAELDAAVREATAGLPEDALTGTRSYLSLRDAFSAQADAYLPFLAFFGVLGLLVALLITGNVVSGAVISGRRHIGVLKALGFTPNQVVAVYLLMVSVPALTGALLGTAAGAATAGPFLKLAFTGIETGGVPVGVSPWLIAGCLLGMPLLVLLIALVPASRAHRLSAVEAISAGSAPRPGRGLRAQRRLASSRLPRPVSLGLGRLFARPVRSAVTLAAVALGVTTVTLTTGLSATLVAFSGDGRRTPVVDVARSSPAEGESRRSADRRTEERLRALPGAEAVTARVLARAQLQGGTRTVSADFYRGDVDGPASRVVEGRWPERTGEAAAGPGFLRQQGLAVGDRFVVRAGGRQVPMTVVGKLLDGDAGAFTASWPTLARLAPGATAWEYRVVLAEGSDAAAYARAVRAVDPALRTSVSEPAPGAVIAVVGFASVFTLLLALVAALGVLHSVLLDVRERRRDLGMLKAVGMTPRQVVVMTVASVAALGAAGGVLGVPLGIGAHRLVVEHIGVIAFPDSMKDVWHLPHLTGVALAGVLIAAAGALLPARSAARLPIAEVLHTE
ncbi:FtsX-like permease family protein [Streptomyces albidoflavus]